MKKNKHKKKKNRRKLKKGSKLILLLILLVSFDTSEQPEKANKPPNNKNMPITKLKIFFFKI